MFAASKTATPAGGGTDPQFNYVTMLLHGDGTNGAQNNTFLDSSTNNFTITRNGNTTQGSFSPFSKEPGKWGVAFDGSGDYLNLSSAAALTLGSGDFTVEAWVYLAGHPGSNIVLDMRTSGVLTAPVLYWNGTGFAWYGNQSTLISGSAYNPNNQWTHVAVCKNSGSTRLFINGVQSGSTYSDSLNYTCGQVRIGASFSPGDGWLGTISNLRIVKGTALYTSNFTPSTTPLTAVSGTSLLTCQSNRFIDNSSNNFTLTPNGNVAVTPFSPFAPSAAYSPAVNGGSGYFDGSGDYLQSASGGFALGSGSFTAECWFYATELTSGSYYALMGSGWQASGGWYFAARTTGIHVYFQPSGFSQEFSATVVANSWNHVALVRSGSSVTVYLNGIALASQSNSGNLTAAPGAIGVSDYSAESGYSYFFKGFIADARTVVGTAVYTSNFTPPTAPLTAITNTQLLTNFTNGAIYDNAMMNDLETVGNAQISTSVKKYGTGSLAFDGTGDYLTALHLPSQMFGSGDFTIEGWLYKPNNDADHTVVAKWGTGGWGILFYTTAGRTKLSFMRGDGTVAAYDPDDFPTNQWVHFSVTRSGTTLRLFVNGVVKSTVTDTNNYTTEQPLYVGGLGSSFVLNGYIDDLRITKGVARYTANFTPPTAAFPNQ